MKLDKLYIDQIFLGTLQTLAAREGFLVDDYEGNSLLSPSYALVERKAIFKNRLLIYMTLFDKIDSFSSLYDLSFLKNEGLIREDSLLNVHKFDSNPKTKRIFSPNEIENLLDFCHNTSINLIDLNQRRTINWLSKFELNLELREHDISEIKIFLKASLIKQKKGYSYSGGFYGYDFEKFEDVDSNVSILIDNLQYSMYYSLIEKAPFVSGLLANMSDTNQNQKPHKLIDNLYYLTKTKLTDEIRFLPYPKNLSDVFNFRKKKEIIRFREVLGLWLDELVKGDDIAEKKIRKDLKKANVEIKRLESWKEYSNSPLNFTINSIGGHIPILSNILTALYTTSGFYERYINKKYNWIMLVK